MTDCLNESQKIDFVRNQLLEWYSQHGRVFAWRQSGLSAYQYIIAEVLLQRTKAEKVAEIYCSFLSQYSNWKDLADANVDDLALYLTPLGLQQQRASRLKQLGVEMQLRKGEIPFLRSELATIPLIGQYIGNAIELIIFKRRTPLLDVNMARVIERIFEPRKLVDIRYDPGLKRLSCKLVDTPNALEINWAILDYAAKVCKARKPLCPNCSLNRLCKFFLKQN